MGLEQLLVEHVDLSITVKKDEENCILFFNGKIDMENPEKILMPFFDELHIEVMKNGIHLVICDLEKLVFLNSRGMKSLVHWILNVPREEIDKQYKVFFKVNREITWQEKSITSLTYILPEGIQII